MQGGVESIVVIAIVAAFSVFLLSGLLMYIVFFTQQKLKEKQAQLYKAVIEAQELEQQRIGRDLHDEVGPLLTLLKFSLEKFGDESEESKELITQAIANIRRAAHNLLPPDMATIGLYQSINKLCQNFDSQTTVEVNFVSQLDVIQLASWQNIHVFRIIAELITNALRHANAEQIIVLVKEDTNNTLFSIMDDGIGLDPTLSDLKDGIGWQNIKHRLNLLNGTYSLKSEPNNGTQIELCIPKNV